MRNYFFLLLLCICFSCSDLPEPDLQKKAALEHQIETQLNEESLASFDDPFFLDSAYIAGTELWVEVSYSGGCETHDFLFVWPEEIITIYPPEFGITLYHDSNGDGCEAFIHDTLKVDLTDTPIGKFDEATIAEIRLTVINGSKPEETRIAR